MLRQLATVLFVLALAAPAGALAYSIQGGAADSGGRAVTYYNAAPEHDWAVEQAVRAWNRSGARVEFTPASRGEAELLIEAKAQGLNGHATSTSRDSGPQPGDAHVSLPIAASGSAAREQRFSVALIAAHELGHVLGLGHEDSRCATMNSTITAKAPIRCSQPPAGRWRCGLLEGDDVRGVVSLYGGRPEPRRRTTCPKVPPKPKPPPPPPLTPANAVEVAADFGGAGRVTVRWLNGDSDRIRSAVVAREHGRCPSEPGDLERRTVRVDPSREGRVAFPLELESACYAVWSRDRSGSLSSEPATAWLDGPASPRPPTNFAATTALGLPLGTTGVSLRWHNAELPTLRKVVIARGRGRCPARPPRRPRPWNSPPARSDVFQEHSDLGFYPAADARQYCYAVFSRDRFGRLSRPATAWPAPAGASEVIVLAG